MCCLCRWQDSKRTFDGTNSITLPVLAGLHMRQGAAGMAVTPTGPVLSAVHLRQLYDPTIDGIIEQAQALCRKARADSGVSCNKVGRLRMWQARCACERHTLQQVT